MEKEKEMKRIKKNVVNIQKKLRIFTVYGNKVKKREV